MPTTEEVIISFKLRDNVTKNLNSIKQQINSISKINLRTGKSQQAVTETRNTINKINSEISKVKQISVKSDGSANTVITQLRNELKSLNQEINNTSKNLDKLRKGSGKGTGTGGKTETSSSTASGGGSTSSPRIVIGDDKTPASTLGVPGSVIPSTPGSIIASGLFPHGATAENFYSNYSGFSTVGIGTDGARSLMDRSGFNDFMRQGWFADKFEPMYINKAWGERTTNYPLNAQAFPFQPTIPAFITRPINPLNSVTPAGMEAFFPATANYNGQQIGNTPFNQPKGTRSDISSYAGLADYRNANAGVIGVGSVQSAMDSAKRTIESNKEFIESNKKILENVPPTASYNGQKLGTAKFNQPEHLRSDMKDYAGMYNFRNAGAGVVGVGGIQNALGSANRVIEENKQFIETNKKILENVPSTASYNGQKLGTAEFNQPERLRSDMKDYAGMSDYRNADAGVTGVGGIQGAIKEATDKSTRDFTLASKNEPLTAEASRKANERLKESLRDQNRERANSSKGLDEIHKKWENLNRTTARATNNFENTSKSFSSMGGALVTVSQNVPKVTQNLPMVTKSINESAKAVPDFSKGLVGAGRSLSGLADALYGVHTPFEKFLGLIGSGSIMTDMVTQASIRQSNQIMLSMNKTTEQAEAYYDAIQKLVISLPGNDDFMNNLLVQISSMDQSIDIPAVEQIGHVVSDYYMLARAKGQTNFETEREIRNYLLTGSTLALQNSVISSQLKTLKNINNIKDRSIALEKAMQAVGMDGLAHYDSYNNVLETFRGRFQKAFADMGTPVIWLAQQLMKLFNAMDNLTNSGLAVFVISLIGTITALMGAVTALGISFRVFEMGLNSFLGFTKAISTLRSGVAGFRSLSTAIGSVTNAIMSMVGAENLEEAYRLRDLIFRKLGITIIKTETKERETNAGVVTYETVAVETNIRGRIKEILVGEKGIGFRLREIGVKLLNIAIQLRVNAVILYHIIIKGDESLITQINTDTTIGNITSKIAHSYATTKDTLTTAWSAITKGDEASVIELNTLAQEGNTLAKIGNALATAKGTIIDIWSAIVKGNDAVITDLDTLAEDGNTLAKVISTIAKVIHTDMTIGEGLAKIFDMEATNALTGSELALAGATFTVDAAMAPLIVTALVIAGVVIAVVVAIEKLGEAFGWWKDFGSMLDAISSGIGRIWEAFINSEPVQQVIKTFQDFAYVIQSLFNLILSMGGNIWELIFGTGKGDGEFDIVGMFLEIVGAIGNFLYWLSPLEEILSIFDMIGGAIGYFLDQWNIFVNSSDFEQIMIIFQELRKEFGEIWETLNTAFSELGEAWSEAFGTEDVEEAEEQSNWLSEVLKSIAWILTSVIVPVIKAIILLVKILVAPFVLIADTLKWIIDGVNWLLGNKDNINPDVVKPSNIANQEGGYNTKGFEPYNYAQTQGLTKNYTPTTNNNQTVINNNFSEGSVQADARNMTQKDVQKLFTGALGYNKARGTKGILKPS